VALNANNSYPSDEIDLRALILTLWTSKVLIIVITLIFTCIGAAYAFLSSPIYQASVHTLPSTSSGLASYNIASQLTGAAIRGAVPESSTGIEPLSTEAAYKIFLRHLNSSTIRQEFFEKFYLPAQAENETEIEKQRAWKRLNDELTITLPKRVDEVEASLRLEGKNPHTIAGWANTYVELATQAASEELLDGLAGEVSIRKLSVVDQIATLRQIAEKTRRSRIARIEEALAIAEGIGLENPAEGIPLIAINTYDRDTENVTSGNLLYLRGSRALRAELQQLHQRESDDPYIPEMPNLLKKQALLNSIDLNPDLLSVATIDRAAIAPEEPIKPQKGLIILVGFILGVFSSIFFVLLLRIINTPEKL